ncbi:MAG: thioredoxin TrxC [Cellvibrio sp.]|uniref:thioredoxin TrxC n=1 Tax=Cellvibrio sp. TaxID=1965322 RepID=UPI0031B4A19B
MSATQINCPHCFATNRLPSERLTDKPNCGKCKQPLFAGKPLDLTAANVAATLEKNDIPVLVDCWASWCGPCQSFAPVFEQITAESEPYIRFAKLDTENEQAIAQSWGIRSIPTLILFKGGKEVARESGAMSMQQLKQWLVQSKVFD